MVKLPKNKQKEGLEEIEEQIVLCECCGYQGPLSEFLAEDPDDTFCPECGEDEELVFVM